MFQLATLLAATVPAWSKVPPAYRVVPDRAREVTSPAWTGLHAVQEYRPLPRALHAEPFHRAMLLAATVPALPNSPAANTLVPDTANASTRTTQKLHVLPAAIPAPRALHVLVWVFQAATSWTVTAVAPLWAVVKIPPTYRVVPLTASASTSGDSPLGAPLTPPDRFCQAWPSHSAT